MIPGLELPDDFWTKEAVFAEYPMEPPSAEETSVRFRKSALTLLRRSTYARKVHMLKFWRRHERS